VGCSNTPRQTLPNVKENEIMNKLRERHKDSKSYQVQGRL